MGTEQQRRQGRSVTRALVHIQAHLGDELTLSGLAGVAGYSPSRFHRLFKTAVGESPRAYVERLRVERAALRLWLHDTTILAVALDVGFRSHETFIRAFRRRFGVVPTVVRKRGLGSLDSLHPRRGLDGLAEASDSYHLSDTKVVTLKPLELAFLRHVGPYEDVPSGLFDELQAWARGKGIESGTLLGIGHDAPGITPEDQLRFDAAIPVAEGVRTDGSVGRQRLPGGRFAVTTHVGPYSTLTHAMVSLFNRILSRRDVSPAGVPVIEMYHENRITPDLRLNHTDIYLPVIPKSRARTPSEVTRR